MSLLALLLGPAAWAQSSPVRIPAAATAPADPMAPVSDPMAPADAYTLVGPTAFTLQLPFAADLQAELATRDHAGALALLPKVDPKKVTGAATADLAFVKAWTLQRAGRGTEAVPLLEVVQKAPNAPRAYVDLVVGEILLADGRPIDAAVALQRVDGASPIEVRARLALADAYQRAGRTADARAVLAALAARPDPSPGSAAALWVLAQRAGLTSPEGQGYVHRLYQYYPGSAEDQAAAAAVSKPTLEDLARRGDRLQEAGNWDTAVALLTPRLAEAGTKDAVGCVYRYAYGRAQHKRNNVTEAAGVLAAIGRGCKGVDDDRGAKALYLAGKSYERIKQQGNAAQVYLAIPSLYPTHSMADDGYTLGGIALQETGDLPSARRAWSQGFEAFPHGDLAGETAWRLAWGAFLGGDTTEAIRWADRCRTEVPLAASPTDVLACHYWGARWRAWPDRDQPDRRTTDAAALQAAADGLDRLATDHPWHYYSVLAASRLGVLAPERAARLARPTLDPADAPWQVHTRFLHSPAVGNAMGLVRVGLYADALTELASLDQDTLSGSEMALVTGLQGATPTPPSATTSTAPPAVPGPTTAWLVAHDRLRGWLKTHPPEELGPNAGRIMRQAYPELWWPEVQTAAKYTWDARVFHALVREESNFNPQIRSHAGACGLSQLMPTTASGSAKRMGLVFRSADIWNPAINLKIGAWYLNTLHTRYHDNSAVALAGYNAGELNADRWLAAHPDWPTDAYVESITFRETRHYVKRVLSTWQTYRLLYADGPLYADWTRFVDDAVP